MVVVVVVVTLFLFLLLLLLRFRVISLGFQKINIRYLLPWLLLGKIRFP